MFFDEEAASCSQEMEGVAPGLSPSWYWYRSASGSRLAVALPSLLPHFTSLLPHLPFFLDRHDVLC
jgi:hypothetical protein